LSAPSQFTEEYQTFSAGEEWGGAIGTTLHDLDLDSFLLSFLNFLKISGRIYMLGFNFFNG
jgi:hypothetical protein